MHLELETAFLVSSVVDPSGMAETFNVTGCALTSPAIATKATVASAFSGREADKEGIDSAASGFGDGRTALNSRRKSSSETSAPAPAASIASARD